MKLASNDNKKPDIIQVYLADGSYKSVRVDSHTTVQRIVDVVLNGLGVDTLSHCRFALRLSPQIGVFANNAKSTPKLSRKKSETSSIPTDTETFHWLHPSLRIPQLRKRYIEPTPVGLHLRFELRIRFIPNDLREMYQTEMAAFLYLYEQLMVDYVKHVAWRIDTYKAFEIAALAIRKRFPNLTRFVFKINTNSFSENLEKRLDFGVIEREGGLIKYLPESILIDNKVGWHLNTAVDVYVGEALGLSYFTENSKSPISLALLQNITNLTIQPLPANSHELQTTNNNASPQVVRIKLSATTTQLTFTLPNLNISESFAHLIDGYHRMLSNNPNGIITAYNSQYKSHSNASVWRYNGEITERPSSPISPTIPSLASPIVPRKDIENNLAKRRLKSPINLIFYNNGNLLQDLPSNINNNNFASKSIPTTPLLSPRLKNKTMDFEDLKPVSADSSIQKELFIDMRSIRLDEFLGDGQFGNVYRGIYGETSKSEIAVAVKVCKIENDFCDTTTSNKFLLDEARKYALNIFMFLETMAQFKHPHIVKLMGVCQNVQTVWIVMELASEGELRAYLHRERHSPALDLSVQLLFAHQLASALSYLHSKQYLHRDVAARNCLVSNPRCVKISDFGLSRQVDSNDEIYTASQGKLPIKWLPPESINYRKFSVYSDVYMFGICIWEILTYGVKPWQGIRNHEVIQRVERGEILPKPSDCPDVVYNLLKQMWNINPQKRIGMQETNNFLLDLLDQIDKQIPYQKLQMPNYQTTENTPFYRNQNICPALKVDMSKVAPSTIWRTLEQQRVQCDADEKWLEQLDINENNDNHKEQQKPRISFRNIQQKT